MKKIIFLFATCMIVIASCTGVKTVSSGLENESFLEFIGDPGEYSIGVNVAIDDNNNFIAEVNKQHANRPKGKVYAICTGAHTLTVSFNNTIIYKKKIFISAQETKKIILP